MGTRTFRSNGTGSIGEIIQLIAEEGIVTGDAIAYTTVINGHATKAVYALRTSSSINTGFVQGKIINIGGDNYVCTFVNGGFNTLTAVAFSVDRATMSITFGSQTGGILNASVNSYVYDISMLDTDKFAISYIQQSKQLKVLVGTVSSLNISFASSTVVYSNSGLGGNWDVHASSFGTDRTAIIIDTDNSATPYVLLAYTVTGTTPNSAVAVVLNSIDTLLRERFIRPVIVDTDKLVILPTGGSDRGMAFSFAGSVWTNGALFHFPSASASAIKVATDQFYAVQNSDIYYFQVSTLTISVLGSLPSTISNLSNANLMTDGTDFFLYYVDNTNTYNSGVWKISWDGVNTSIEPVCNFHSGLSGTGIWSPNGYYFVAGQISGSTISYHIEGLSNGYIGFAQQNANRGDTINVKISGVDSNQSNLIAGAFYKVENGGLSITANNPSIQFKVQAQDATSVKI